MKEEEKIVQFYIIDSRNVIGKPIFDENGVIIGGLEIADNKKFVPMSWSFIFYDLIPDELLITDNKCGLFSFILNFNEKILQVGDKGKLPIINYEEILNHWKELNEDKDIKEVGGIKIPAINREEHTILLKRVGKGWKFSFENISEGISIEQFIKDYVSLEKFSISDIGIEFSRPQDKFFDEFYIGDFKINIFELIEYNAHFLLKDFFKENKIYNEEKVLGFQPNCIFYRGGNDSDNFVKNIKFRIISEILPK